MTGERGTVRCGNTDINYSVLRSTRRRKTVQIVLDPDDGVLVAVPAAATSEEIAAVVTRRAGWIVREASARVLQPRAKEFISGESLPYLGRQVRLFVERAETRQVRVQFRHWSFHIYAPADLTDGERRVAIQRALMRWYRARAASRLAGRVEHWSALAGFSAARVLVRGQRQRWGSCGPDGTLRFNWRIIMAPPALVDYVVLHELVHMRIKNHSSAFWSEVGKLLPDYRLRRARLKELGSTLTH